MRRKVQGRQEYIHTALKQLCVDLKKRKMTAESGNLFLSLVSMLPDGCGAGKNGKNGEKDQEVLEMRSDLNRCMSALNLG